MKPIILFFFACIVLNSTAQVTPTVIYNFNGSTTDISGNGNDGTLFGGATSISNLRLLNNTSDYLEVPADAIDGLDDFTVSFRIKFAQFHLTGSFPTNHIFSGSRSGCVQCFGMAYEKALNVWKFALNGIVYEWDDSDVELDTWYCVSLSRISNTITLYKQGESLGSYVDGSEVDITSFLIGQEDDCVGGCFVTNQCMFGKMDNFQVWDGFHFGCNFNAHNTKEGSADNEVFSSDQITLYPNPVNDYLNVQIKNNFSGIVSIMNINGQIISETNSTEEKTVIDVRSLSAGLYVVGFNNGNEKIMTTFIKL